MYLERDVRCSTIRRSRLPTSIDHFLQVSILQCSRNLLNMRQNACKGQTRASGMAFTQCAIGSIGHDQERDIVLQTNTKFEDMHNMWMIQGRDSACLVEKAILFTACQPGMKYFDSRLRLEVHVLA